MAKINSKSGRRNRIAGDWSALLAEVLESPPWRVLSRSARLVIDRVRLELCLHGGNASTQLCVTYDDFEKYGVHRHSIKSGIREAIALGFLCVTRQGRGGNAAYRLPTHYRLTFMNANDATPTHEWRQFRTMAAAKAAARAARSEARRNRKPPPKTDTGITPAKRTENSKSPPPQTDTTGTAKSAPLSITGSGVGGRAASAVGVSAAAAPEPEATNRVARKGETPSNPASHPSGNSASHTSGSSATGTSNRNPTLHYRTSASSASSEGRMARGGDPP
jgi:hypothetical protein